MTERILIVEDEFIVAHDLQMILSHAGYKIAGIADSVKSALLILEQKEVDLVLLDIFLKGKQTGIDLAKILMEQQMPFIYISANSNEKVLEAAKSTLPYGFIVKPYREKDVLLSIDIARYRTAHSLSLKSSSKPAQGANKIKFHHIIGQSPALLNLLDQVLIVAPTDTSVLITGDSGTGKEMIAQNLHRLSDRKDKPLVAVNCAALPSDLIESILFGHEKGSFTGATSQRIGKFEEASGGTIFLDEIGEMPFDLQAKLLRVLQEKEIERIGGTGPVSVDLRIIAATNLNLEKEIARGKFRLDLFFRLNVFPLKVPSLIARKEDIPYLTSYFIEKHAKALNKSITKVSTDFTGKLMRYDWPGNIRELEHVILRSILLSKSGELHENLLELETTEKDIEKPNQSAIKTILENERDHIIDVLNKCKGKISGTGGAADLLGIPSTTLNSKIKKLGIRR